MLFMPMAVAWAAARAVYLSLLHHTRYALIFINEFAIWQLAGGHKQH